MSIARKLIESFVCEASNTFLMTMKGLAREYNGYAPVAKAHGVYCEFSSVQDCDNFVDQLDKISSVEDYVVSPKGKSVFVSEDGDIDLEYSQW